MVFEFSEVGGVVAVAEGFGKQAVLGDEATRSLHIAANCRGCEALLTLAQRVTEMGKQAIAAVVHDGLVETRIEVGVCAQVTGVERGVLFRDGRIEAISNDGALCGGRAQIWRAEWASTSRRAS